MRILEKKNKKDHEPYVVIINEKRTLCDWVECHSCMDCRLCIAGRRDRKELLTEAEALEIWKDAEYPMDLIDPVKPVK